MTKNYTALAAEILSHVGGKENISFVTHCVTRLRFTVKDKNQVPVSYTHLDVYKRQD